MLVLLGSRDLLLAVATGRWVAGEAQKQLPAEAVAGRCLDIVSGEGYCWPRMVSDLPSSSLDIIDHPSLGSCIV